MYRLRVNAAYFDEAVVGGGWKAAVFFYKKNGKNPCSKS
jgi:hypothetical protein